MCFLHWLWIERVIVTTLVMKDENLKKGPLVIARGHARCGLYKTHLKTHKKKFNEIKNFEKTPKMNVGINGIETKRVKF